MTLFLQHLKELLNELACIGEVITDNKVVEHVLMALLDSFEGFVNSFIYRPGLPSVAELTVIHMQDDIRRELRGSRHSDEALLVRGGTKKTPTTRKENTTGDSGKLKNKRMEGKCHFYGKKGHWMRHCPELAEELRIR